MITFVLANLFIIIGFLLLSYFILFRKTPNRPTFFYSKARVFCLIIFAIFLLTLGVLFLYCNLNEDALYTVLFIYFVFIYIFVISFSLKYLEPRLIELFRVYKRIEKESLEADEEERILLTADFYLARIGVEKDSRSMIIERIEKRMRARKKTDILNAAPIIMEYVVTVINKRNVSQSFPITITKRKLRFLFSKAQQDIEEMNPFWVSLFAFDKYIKNFSFISVKMPDFSVEPVALGEISFKNDQNDDAYCISAVFTEHSLQQCFKYGWMLPSQYILLANLEFSRRNKDSDFAKTFFKRMPFTESEIVCFGKNYISIPLFPVDDVLFEFNKTTGGKV